MDLTGFAKSTSRPDLQQGPYIPASSLHSATGFHFSYRPLQRPTMFSPLQLQARVAHAPAEPDSQVGLTSSPQPGLV